MCTTFFKILQKENQRLKFAIAFNRDMSLLRPTKTLSYWKDDQNILGGKDDAMGGSWFLINKKTGNIAYLTNLCEYHGKLPFKLNMKSRGKLIKDFVDSDFFEKNPDYTLDTCGLEYLKTIVEDRESYNCFNLVVGNIFIDKPSLYHLVFNTSEIIKIQENTFYGLSNTLLNEPYKKVQDILDRYTDVVSKESQGDAENLQKTLFEILKTDINFEPEKPLEAEASVFIKPYWTQTMLNVVGSQSQIVLLVDRDNKFHIKEISMSPVFPSINDPIPGFKVNGNKMIKIVSMLIRL